MLHLAKVIMQCVLASKSARQEQERSDQESYDRHVGDGRVWPIDWRLDWRCEVRGE